MYSQPPRIRTPQEVIDSLFSTEPRSTGQGRRSRPEHKRVWASLTKGKAGVIDEVAKEMARRNPSRTKEWVALTDGERALQKEVHARLEDVPLVLDLQHALSKLWKAAYAFHKEGTPEAMLQMRATYLSDDFEEYWAFLVQCEHERLHPTDHWSPVNIVEEK